MADFDFSDSLDDEVVTDEKSVTTQVEQKKVEGNESIESKILSISDDTTATQLLKIAKKYNLSENDPSWLFADVLIASSEISKTAAEASKIAADEAQQAVMQKFDEESEKIGNVLTTRLSSSVDQFSKSFEKEQKKIVRELQSIAQDFETKKMGWKKSTVILILSLIATAAGGGYYIGSGSQLKLINDDILLNSQNYQAVVQRYNKLSTKQRKVIDKLLFQ